MSDELEPTLRQLRAESVPAPSPYLETRVWQRIQAEGEGEDTVSRLARLLSRGGVAIPALAFIAVISVTVAITSMYVLESRSTNIASQSLGFDSFSTKPLANLDHR